ncbi:hypothetical protein ACCT18_05170 [Rhizobium ruizarguesonis]
MMIELPYRRKCRSEAIRLRYDPNAPDRYVFPDFPPNRSWWDGVRDCAFSFIYTLPSLLFAGALTLVIAFPLGALILGLNVFKKV